MTKPYHSRLDVIYNYYNKAMRTNRLLYSTPQSEVVELKMNSIICQSPGGGIDDYENGGKI